MDRKIEEFRTKLKERIEDSTVEACYQEDSDVYQIIVRTLEDNYIARVEVGKLIRSVFYENDIYDFWVDIVRG